MNNGPLGFTELEFNNNSNATPSTNVSNTVTNKRKTLKKMPSLKKHLLNLGESKDSDDTDGNDLADYAGHQADREAFTAPSFKPPPPPVLSKIKQLTNMKNGLLSSDTDNALEKEDYNELNGEQLANDEYYKKYIPYYTQQSNGPQLEMNDNILLEKMNQMIYLLEEQKDEKTNNVTEELILYCFLGVFVIFVVDSFSKTGGKYTR